MSAATVPTPGSDPWASNTPTREFPFAETEQHAPVMVATIKRYLAQLAISSRPATVAATSSALRFFAGQATRDDPELRTIAGLERRHIEAHKTWMATRRTRQGEPLKPVTIAQRLSFLRTFFERLIEWDYPDAPDRQLVFPGDFPERDDALPKFLDDPTAAKFMATLAADPNKRRRLMIELLARTGMRSGELSALEADAMVTKAGAFTQRVEGVPPEAWDNQSPCEEWTARDIIGHLKQWMQPVILEPAHVECRTIPSVKNDPVGVWLALDDAVPRALASPELMSQTVDGGSRVHTERHIYASASAHLGRGTGRSPVLPSNVG